MTRSDGVSDAREGGARLGGVACVAVGGSSELPRVPRVLPYRSMGSPQLRAGEFVRINSPRKAWRAIVSGE